MPGGSLALTLAVAVETPRHTSVGSVLDYSSEQPLAPGTLVRAPLGRREVPGIVWDAATDERPQNLELRTLSEVLDALPPLPADWRGLIDFAAAYYQRGVGELALSVLPPELRKLDATRLARRVAKARKTVADAAEPGLALAPPQLNAEQLQAVHDIAGATQPVLLHGVTGSGKTEVYLHAAAEALQRGRQALVLVPEINLTPQLEARFAARFAGHQIGRASCRERV